jgi:hypothetical protein
VVAYAVVAWFPQTPADLTRRSARTPGPDPATPAPAASS